jgi:hypothetical protein
VVFVLFVACLEDVESDLLEPNLKRWKQKANNRDEWVLP